MIRDAMAIFGGVVFSWGLYQIYYPLCALFAGGVCTWAAWVWRADDK